MTDQERQALLTLAIMAALSDGNDHPAERAAAIVNNRNYPANIPLQSR